MNKRFPVNTDYDFDPRDVTTLQGISSLPQDMRVEIMRKLFARRTKAQLIEMFANFVGLANAVEGNMRDFLELAGIIHGGMNEIEAEKLNAPTVWGALNGIKIATPPVPGMCGGCAFRKGTPANQSSITTIDALDSATGGIAAEFMCHERPDCEDTAKATPCVGKIAWMERQRPERRIVEGGR